LQNNTFRSRTDDKIKVMETRKGQTKFY